MRSPAPSQGGTTNPALTHARSARPASAAGPRNSEQEAGMATTIAPDRSGRLAMTTRRDFLTGLAATCLSRGAFAKGRARPKYRYIDIHTHVGTFYAGKELTASG